MQRIDWMAASEPQRARALRRPAQARSAEVADGVRAILDDVRSRGAAAVADWAVRLDGLPPRRLEIDDRAVADAERRVGPEDLAALRLAAENIRRFHQLDRPSDGEPIEPQPGVVIRRVWRPLDSVGLYIPAGTAPLFSTLLMLAIPASIAEVPERVAVTPPGRGGQVLPMMILAAREAGLDALWLVGGAQAIGALAEGAGLPRVDKILGPGNAWVAEAKRQVAEQPGGPAIDLPAGPSELMVIADASADPAVVAADLLAQAEHDADAQVILATPDARLADAVQAEVAQRLIDLPRSETARRALGGAAVILCADLSEAVDVANRYAPEHLSLQISDAEALLPAIRHAGAVFAGHGAAETFGDYLSGPSHVLPTGASARVASGVTTAAFMKSFTVQTVSDAALPNLAAAAARLARLEGLEAHARAAEVRAPGARA